MEGTAHVRVEDCRREDEQAPENEGRSQRGPDTKRSEVPGNLGGPPANSEFSGQPSMKPQASIVIRPGCEALPGNPDCRVRRRRGCPNLSEPGGTGFPVGAGDAPLVLVLAVRSSGRTLEASEGSRHMESHGGLAETVFGRMALEGTGPEKSGRARSGPEEDDDRETGPRVRARVRSAHSQVRGFSRSGSSAKAGSRSASTLGRRCVARRGRPALASASSQSSAAQAMRA